MLFFPNRIVLLFTCTLLGYAVFAQRNPSCNESLKLYKSGDYDSALSKQEECIKAHPTDGVNYYNRGRIYYQLKEIPKALADYETATRITPDFIQSYYALSQHYLGNKDFDNSLKYITQAILAKPDMASNYNFRGWIYFNFEKYQLAYKDFTKAIDLDPKDASAYNNRGSARYKVQDVEEAVRKDLEMSKADYETALSLDSTLPHLYRNLGYVSLLLKEDSVALKWLNKAIERDPHDAMVYLYQGMVYEQLNDIYPALSAFDRSLGIYGKLAEAFFEKGKTWYKKKNYHATVDNMKKAIELKDALKGEAYYYMALSNAAMFETELMFENLRDAQKGGYFKKQENLVAFLTEPAFNDFKKQKPFVAIVNKLKAN